MSTPYTDHHAPEHIPCDLCGGTRPSLETLRRTASDWHGGQSSALYAFSSTGSIVDGLEAEVRDSLRLLKAGQYSPAEINTETPRLSALLDWVVGQTPTCTCGDGQFTGYDACRNGCDPTCPVC